MPLWKIESMQKAEYKGRIYKRGKPDRRRKYTVILPEIIYQYLKNKGTRRYNWRRYAVYVYENPRGWFAPGKRKTDIIFVGEEANDTKALLELLSIKEFKKQKD